MNVRKNINILFLFLFAFLLGNCAGLKTITIESQEPAQVTLPKNVRSLLVVNNVVTQPKDIGHTKKWLDKSEIENFPIPMDSIAIIYTEALAQFLEEERYFDKVLYYNKPLRTDSDFLAQKPIMPEEMMQFRKEHDVDAIVSLDRFIIITNLEEKKTSGNKFIEETTKIQSIIRVYMPTLNGEIPAIHYLDSVKLKAPVSFNLEKNSDQLSNFLTKLFPQDNMRRDFLKERVVVPAAEKMTKALSPHWETQDRWYYTLSNATMQNGEYYADQSKWDEAVVKWEEFFNANKNTINKAKAASNIALAYEMLEDMEQAYSWITTAYNLFEESVSPNSFDLKRTLLYKNEIERRYKNEKALNAQSL